MRRGTWRVRKISVQCQFLGAADGSAGGTLWLYRTPTLYLAMFFWIVWETCWLLLHVMTAFRSVHLALSISLSLSHFFHLSYSPSVSSPVTDFKTGLSQFFHITACSNVQTTFCTPCLKMLMWPGNRRYNISIVPIVLNFYRGARTPRERLSSNKQEPGAGLESNKLQVL